jgi:autotransporter-associated beta strand protein
MLAGSGALSTNTAVQIAAGASLRLDGYFAPNNINRTIGGLAGAGVLYSAGGTVTVDKASGSDTFSGDIQGGQGLIKAGSGTFVLSGANSYTGGTTISAGTLQIGDGGATGSISGAITNNAALVYNRSNNLSQGGVISGTGTLAKSGNGTLTLDSANTYSGGTVINAGTLRIGNGGTTGSVAGPITNNAALVYNRSDNLTQGGVISGTGALVKSGNGTLTLDSANTYSGATVVSAGTLRLDGSGALSTSTALQVDSGATFSTTGSIATSNNATVAGLTGTGTVSGLAGTLTVSKNTNASDVFSGSINGGIGLTLAGSTQLWLAGSNNYTGATLLSGSDTVLNLVHGSGLGSTAAGTTVSSGSVLRIQGTNNGGSGITVGAEALTIIGQGRAGNGGALRSVSGTNTWQGKVTLSGDARIGAASGSILTLDVASGNAVESANFNFATEGAGHVQVNDAISLGTGSLTKLGTGSLILGAANSYSGGTTLSEGFLRLDHAGAAGSGSITQTTNNSTLQINATGTVANAMSIFNVRTMQTVTLSGHKTLNNATYTVDAGTTTTESGNLTGAGGITKQGTGTLLVTGNNSYTGAVSVNAGVLNLNSSVGGAAATTSSVSVANGATLLLSQSDQVSNTAAVTLSGGTIQRASGVSEVFGSLNLTTSSFLDFSGGTAGTIEFSGISYTPSALLALNIANFTQGNTLVFQTTNSLSMTGFNFSGSGGFGSSSFNGSTFTITAIPEPSTWLAAAGLLGLLLWPLRNRFADAVRRS